jgi:hypothetical protein
MRQQHEKTRAVRIDKDHHEQLKKLSEQYHVSIKTLMETAVTMLLTAHNQTGVTALFTEAQNEPDRNTGSTTRIDEPGR